MLLNNIVESKLLYVNNKILEWFNNKSEEEKKKLLYKEQNIYDFREIQKIDFIKEIFYEFKRKIRGYKKKEEEKRR